MRKTCGQERLRGLPALALAGAVFGVPFLALSMAGVHSEPDPRPEDAIATPRMVSVAPAKAPADPRFQLHAGSFSENQQIPRNFTCDGQDISPMLTWTEPPARTQSFVLIADDPDAPAGTWVHWVVYNLPADSRQLPQGAPKDPEFEGGGRQGVNDFQKIGYNGPCPPPGKPHRYFFRLYALDSRLDLPSGATKAAVEQAMEGHVLAETRLAGRYGR